MLRCPRCEGPLQALRYGPSAVWGCAKCGGCASTTALLRGAVRPDRFKPLQRAFATAARASPRRCPGCKRPMLSADAGGLEIDSCRRCQLLWFDRGEAPEPEPRATLAPEEAAAAVRAEADGDQGVEAAPPFALRRILGLLGLPVEIDAPVRGIVPWATIGMGIVLIVVGLLTLGDRVTSALYGFLPSRPFRSHGATLLTYFFLHANLLHLFGNAYFLAVFGDNVEEAAGRARFLAMTLAGSAAGAILHGLFEPARDVPLIGASAGVSAILVYYVFRFPRARIGWFVFTLPAWGYGLVWAGIQFTDAVAQATGQSNVSAFAHIGGAAVGVAFFAVARRMGSWNSADAQRL